MRPELRERILAYNREKAANRHRGVCIEGATSCENLMDMVDYMVVDMEMYYYFRFVNFQYYYQLKKMMKYNWFK